MADPITSERLARLRQLHEAATAGPWGWRGHDDGLVELRGHGPFGAFDGRIVSALRSDPCIVTLDDETVALAFGACDVCRDAYENRDLSPDRKCTKDDNLGTVYLNGKHAIEPANTWAVREQPHRCDVARVDHPDAELIAETRNALPDLLDEIDRLRRLLDEIDSVADAVYQLKVTTDGPGIFTVDAEALACSDECIRYWRLVETPTGQWRHHESGVEDRLLLVLRSIAQHYLDHRCPHDRQEADRG